MVPHFFRMSFLKNVFVLQWEFVLGKSILLMVKSLLLIVKSCGIPIFDGWLTIFSVNSRLSRPNQPPLRLPWLWLWPWPSPWYLSRSWAQLYGRISMVPPLVIAMAHRNRCFTYLKWWILSMAMLNNQMVIMCNVPSFLNFPQTCTDRNKSCVCLEIVPIHVSCGHSQNSKPNQVVLSTSAMDTEVRDFATGSDAG
jgi:hypothetical protein